MSSFSAISQSTNDKLVYMANQIGAFFKSQDRDTASAKIAEHITKFWDPRMRKAIVAHIEAGGAGLEPAARQAVELLRPKPATAVAAPLHLSPTPKFAAEREGGPLRSETGTVNAAHERPSRAQMDLVPRPPPRLGRWLLLISAVLGVAGIFGLIATSRIDVVEIEELLRQGWQR